MSIDLASLDTGIKVLDDDVRELFSLCEDKEKLDAVRQAIANKRISVEEFIKIVPESLLRLAVIFRKDQERVIDQISGSAVGVFKAAKKLFEEQFDNLLENETVQTILKAILKKTQKEEGEESLADDVIRGVGYYYMWEDTPPELTPATRIAFYNRKDKRLLNTTLDWEDFSGLLKMLSKGFMELLEKGIPLAELKQIDTSDCLKISKDIEEAMEDLQKAKDFMPLYKNEDMDTKDKQLTGDSSCQD